jgi:hypothetical protein
MKNKNIILCLAAFLCTGCESYLDRQPDESFTSKNIFEKQTSTLLYLVNVYSHVGNTTIMNETDPSGQKVHYTPSSDEATCVFTGRDFAMFNNSTWAVNSEDHNNNNKIKYWIPYYTGIREASYFMGNVGRCPELTGDQINEYAAEARFLRAYFYFCLMRLYGPVVLLGEKEVDFNDPALRYVDRNTWDECVNWVAEECDKAAAHLPLSQTAEFPGRATKGAALALKARLLLYSARELFNGHPMYVGKMKNAEGKYLFPQTPDAAKWTIAAQAALDVMELNKYRLIDKDDFNGDVYKAIQAVFRMRWNPELIFAMQITSRAQRIASIPKGVGSKAYGGVGPTQKLVDAFAMADGRYPVTGYNPDGSPKIDPLASAAGYSESGSHTFTHPILGQTKETFDMYVNREPRFYTSIFYTGLNWKGGSKTVPSIDFFYGGNSGTGTPSDAHNYSPTGYIPFKFQDIDTDNTVSDEKIGFPTITWPLFRYAEVLLNRAEALNEQPERDAAGALECLNEVRNRAGMPDLETIYPEVTGDKVLMREMIRRERFIELNFENHRYFDTRTWAIAEVENAGNVYGMNIMAPGGNKDTGVPPAAYWQRTVIPMDGGNRPSTRVFNAKNYLLPVPQSELDRLPNITQNYLW